MRAEILLNTQAVAMYGVGYLLGSLPFSVWVGKLFFGVDVREHGSKNAGATNTFRILGKKAAIPVLLLDIFKGFLATSLIYLFANIEVNHDSSTFVFLKILCGAFAVLGHLYPVFAQFRGGKGVATLFGMVIGLHPWAACASFLVFLLVFLSSKYISLGAMVGSFCFMLISLVIDREDRTAMVVFAIAQFLLLLFTHRKNIARLRKGTENKIYLSKKGQLEK